MENAKVNGNALYLKVFPKHQKQFSSVLLLNVMK